MSFPPMGVTIYGRPQGSPNPNATASLSLVVHHPGGGRAEHRVNLWDHGDQLAHDAVHNNDQTARGMLADWADENSDHFQAVPEEYRKYVGQLIRRGHRWPPEPPVQMSRLDVKRRYGRVPADELAGHFEGGEAGGSYNPQNVADAVFADKLADADDPRELHVRRDLSYRGPGTALSNNVDAAHKALAGQEVFREHPHTENHDLGDGTILAVSPVGENPHQPTSYEHEWYGRFSDRYGLRSHHAFVAVLSPDEHADVMRRLGLGGNEAPEPTHMSRRGAKRRYGLLPENEIRTFTQQGRQNGQYDPNNTSDLVFADRLEDADDPRHMIVRRDIEHRGEGGTNTFIFNHRQHHERLAGGRSAPLRNHPEHLVHNFPDGTSLAVSPQGEINRFENDEDQPATSHEITWDTPYNVYYGAFSPDEKNTLLRGLGLGGNEEPEQPPDEYDPPGTPTGGPGSPGGMYYSRRLKPDAPSPRSTVLTDSTSVVRYGKRCVAAVVGLKSSLEKAKYERRTGVRRYSDRSIDATNHDALASGLRMLSLPEHVATRVGGTHNPDADHTFRGQLSDLLRDHGREDEADLLQNPDTRVNVNGGRITDALIDAVSRAKREVNDDIKNGVIPADVNDFSQLHDHVDANGYGGAFEDDALSGGERTVDKAMDFWNQVQDQVHQWLHTGRPEDNEGKVGPDDVDHNNTKLARRGAVRRYAFDERAQFEKAIDANPEDPLTHGVYADWLDDNGHHDEAKFRRVMGEWLNRGVHEHLRARPLRRGLPGRTYDSPARDDMWLVEEHAEGPGGFQVGERTTGHGAYYYDNLRWPTYRAMEASLRRGYENHVNQPAPTQPTPEADPNVPMGKPERMSRRGTVRRYSATEGSLPAMLASVTPRMWRGWPHTNQNSPFDLTPRVVAADYLQDLGRDREAAILRDTTRHAYLEHDGQVHDAGEISRERHETAGRHGHGAAADLPSDERQYLRTALWSSADDEGNLDAEHDEHSIHPDTMGAMLADYRHFKNTSGYTMGDNTSDGHNFWLSRNGHGTGFMDAEDWSPDQRDELQKRAQQHGSYDLHVGDDGLVHGSYEATPVPDEPHHMSRLLQRRYASVSRPEDVHPNERERPDPVPPNYGDSDRRLWVLNHEPLYRLWQSTLGPEVDRDQADPGDDGFIDRHRDEIDDEIRRQPGMDNYPDRMSRRRYTAYRAPAGGMIVRGTGYKGGEMVPDMEGEFANPPQQPVRKEEGATTPSIGDAPYQVNSGTNAGRVRRIDVMRRIAARRRSMRKPKLPT